MGAAAYNRGSRAITQQIESELADNAYERSLRMHAANLEDRVVTLQNKNAALQKELAALKADHERAHNCIQRMRLTATANREESDRTVEHWRTLARQYLASSERYLSSWRKASALIRTCLTPQQVDDYRSMRDESL